MITSRIIKKRQILDFEVQRWGIKLADEGLIPQKTLVNLHFYNQKLESLSSNNSLHKNTRKMPEFKHYLASLGCAVPLVRKKNQRLFYHHF